jgi:4-hydroxybenzoyl-CoA reductase subunit gamma
MQVDKSGGEHMTQIVTVTVNGRTTEAAIGDSVLLIDWLRDTAGLTSPKKGCDGGECGACTVLVDGRPRQSCLTLAAACDGRTIETVEGLAVNGRLTPLQRAFHERLGAQCGFCTPGMVMAATALLRTTPHPSEGEIRVALSGNLCRCTGYVKIVDSVKAAAGAGP